MRLIKPTGQRVLVEPMLGDVSKVGSIHIPEAAQDRAPMEASVVAIGGGVKEPDFKVGDRVVIARHGGTEVKVGTRMLKLMAVEEVLAVVE